MSGYFNKVFSLLTNHLLVSESYQLVVISPFHVNAPFLHTMKRFSDVFRAYRNGHGVKRVTGLLVVILYC